MAGSQRGGSSAAQPGPRSLPPHTPRLEFKHRSGAAKPHFGDGDSRKGGRGKAEPGPAWGARSPAVRGLPE